jgi:outer membrane protein TolC
MVILIGCGQHGFVTEGDVNHCDHLASCHGGNGPADPGPASVAAVSTVLNPEGDSRLISLSECIALALEHGRVGGKNIRVLAYDPALIQTGIATSLSRFDAVFRSSLTWNAIDEPVGSALQNVLTNPNLAQVLNNGVVVNPVNTNTGNRFIPGTVVRDNNATFSSGITKPLPTGGTAGITFKTDYDLSNEVQALNPLYRPRVVFDFEQPLLKGFGVCVNHTGILLARLDFDQARTKFAANVQDLLFVVEEAYWNLYFAYWNLYTVDTALRQAHDAWQKSKASFDRKEATIQDVSLLEQSYQAFRLARLDALGGGGRSVLEAERQLRLVVGLPADDGCRLIPTDTPTRSPLMPSWQAALAEALQNRPELIEVRTDIKKAQLDIKLARNLLLPDLKAIGSYDINGLGTKLTGPNFPSFDGNALRSLASDRFNDWTVGLQLEVPIGNRAAHAALRRAELALAQRQAELHDLESQVTFNLQRSYRQLVTQYEKIKVAAAVLKTSQEQFNLQNKLVWQKESTVNLLTDAQKVVAGAAVAFQAAIFDYNIAIADFERAKGTLMQYDNVTIAEGALPSCVQAQASKHIHDRQSALVLRERAAACDHDGPPGCCASAAAPVHAADQPPSIPIVVKNLAPLPGETQLPPMAPAVRVGVEAPRQTPVSVALPK